MSIKMTGTNPDPNKSNFQRADRDPDLTRDIPVVPPDQESTAHLPAKSGSTTLGNIRNKYAADEVDEINQTASNPNTPSPPHSGNSWPIEKDEQGIDRAQDYSRNAGLHGKQYLRHPSEVVEEDFVFDAYAAEAIYVAGFDGAHGWSLNDSATGWAIETVGEEDFLTATSAGNGVDAETEQTFTLAEPARMFAQWEADGQHLQLLVKVNGVIKYTQNIDALPEDGTIELVLPAGDTTVTFVMVDSVDASVGAKIRIDSVTILPLS